MAANVKGGSDETRSSTTSSTAITAQQLEKLIKMLPTLTGGNQNEADEDMDVCYSGMVSCNLVKAVSNEWIVDSGATHHMTGNKDLLTGMKSVNQHQHINRPNGGTSEIKRVGEVNFLNGLTLKNVLYLPSFKHNLLSVKKLSQDSSCRVVFRPETCSIQDEKSGVVKAMAKEKQGLYYLHNQDEVKIKDRSPTHCTKVRALNVDVKLNVLDRVQGARRMKGATL
ncbi:Retrovirus-related Pol polyprotein from transposon RE1 [Bienertia sinuspersici]